MARYHLLLIVLLCLFASVTSPTMAEDPVDYTQDIKPILSRRCYSCHGVLKQEHDLRLDTAELAKTGGSGGPVIIAGQSAASRLLDAIQGTNDVPRMPPEGEPLSAAQIDLIKRWIDAGAKAPHEAVPKDPAQHWAYQIPRRPPLPTDVPQPWLLNPIDAFIAAAQAGQQLTPSPPAPKPVLLRRLYLDLIGLPPTRDQLRAFLADEDPQALERVVDRLLDSPQYGERWGRHWMDVWRYSDWDGYGAEVRESKPHIWRWRDWIIESLNADQGYDRMLQEMLAGDELAPHDPQVRRATGYLVRNWYSFNRNVWLDATIEHTGKAFLGTTLNCARCHDHMYDPISQAEYYQFRAFFEAHDVRTDRIPGQPDLAKDGLVHVYDAKGDTPTYLFQRGNEKQFDQTQPLAALLPAIFRNSEVKIEPISLPAVAYYPGLQPFQQTEAIQQAQAGFDAAQQSLTAARGKSTAAKKQWDDFVAKRPAETEKKPPQVVISDDFSKPRPELWKPTSGEWVWENGKLLQKSVRNAWTGIVAETPPPADCLIQLKLKSTGGEVYKSVGLSFDLEDPDNFSGVYLSVSGKVQIFHRQQGQDSYPPAASKARPVELNRDYELQVAISGRLVNVWVDGGLQIAYEMPMERKPNGRIALWTYDATAEFQRLSVAELAADFALVRNVGEAATPVSEAQLAQAVASAQQLVKLAERTLSTAIANRIWVQARIQADRAAFATPPAPNAEELASIAILAEREHQLRVVDQKLDEAERKLAEAKQSPANPQPIAAAEMGLAAAQKARDDAYDPSQTPAATYTKFGALYPATSTGRRLALARWIANKNNPLTARVAINHIWLRHMGQPIVPTVFDFGLNGKPPTHPELLDWLAVELMEHDWKMKPIHKQIVLSRTYAQQSMLSSAQASNLSRDPDNQYLWRANSRRLEAEAVRDAILLVSGNLNLTAGGPELDEASGMQVPRRSLYFRNSKEKKMTFLDMFDRPNVVDCYRRSESIVPQQALALANSPLLLAESRRLARTLSEEVGPSAEPIDLVPFISIAFDQILNRPPTSSELEECSQFLRAQTAKFADPTALVKFTGGVATHVPPAENPHQRARENLVHVLMNHNDFITIR